METKYNLNRMNLKTFRAENYRCYNDITVEFKPSINLLIGDNASGKNNNIRNRSDYMWNIP